MSLVLLLVAALLALASGEEHDANTTGGALLLNGTFLDSQIPFDQVNFKPMTKWEGGLEKGVAYRIFQAMPGIGHRYARRFCEGLRPRAQLAKVKSESQWDLLHFLLKKTFKAYGIRNKVYVWIGGRRDYEGKAHWSWNLCGEEEEPFTFTDWYIYEPNNVEGKEHCIHTMTEEHGFKWNDNRCDRPLKFVACQVELPFPDSDHGSASASTSPMVGGTRFFDVGSTKL